MDKLRFAIIGAGNGGQSFTGHLGLLGFPVSLWDVDPQRVEDLRKTNRMVVSGALTGECEIPLVTGNIGEAVEGADIIMMVIPTVFQRSTVKAMAPYLKDGQALVLNPGATGGALEARATLQEEGCPRRSWSPKRTPSSTRAAAQSPARPSLAALRTASPSPPCRRQTPCAWPSVSTRLSPSSNRFPACSLPV